MKIHIPNHIRAAAPEYPSQLFLAAETQWITAGADGKPPALPTFQMVAYTGVPMRLEGFYYLVIAELDGIKAAAQKIPVRLQHDALLGVGHTETVTIEGGKVRATGVVSRETEAAREVTASGKNGFPWQASIGGPVIDAEFVPEKQTVKVNGKTWAGPIIVAHKMILAEISFVDLGADTNTSARVAAKHFISEGKHMDFNEWLKAKGRDPATLSEEEKTTLRAEFDAETKPKDAPAKPAGAVQAQAPADDVNAAGELAKEMRAEGAAEKTRQSEVAKVFAGKFPDVEAKAIGENWDLPRAKTEFELATLRASRPEAPGIIVGADMPAQMFQVLTAAACMSGGLHNLEKKFEVPVLEAAHKMFPRGASLGDLIVEAAIRNGYSGRVRNITPEIMAYASDDLRYVRAGFSTVDIGGILSNVANKYLLEGFMFTEQTWREVCSLRSVKDFKTITSYRLTGKDEYRQVAPTGELKYGTLGEETYTNKADTYGLMLTITRTDIINDDLGAITLVPKKLGRGHGLKLNKVIWTVFLLNAGGTFFAAGHSNVATGAGSALGIAGLTAANTLAKKLKDADGNPIGTPMVIMLIPPELEPLADQLYKSVALLNTTTTLTANPHLNKFRPVVSSYLSNSDYTNWSATAWYILADPNVLAALEVCFLNGQEAPIIETVQAQPDVLGMVMRGYGDFGAALQDPRAGIRSAGV